jgi:hemoglobin
VNDPGAIFAALGEGGFERLVAGFYRRVQSDPLLGPMYPEQDWQGAEDRLREFLVYRCGGPDRYIQDRGHPRLRMRHAPFAITPAARDRWVELMHAAAAEADLPNEACASLLEFLGGVATFLLNRP